MHALRRKLYRDAWHYKGQLAAVAATVMCGIALFITLRSMKGFMEKSRDDFYSEYHFAHVFANVKRAPMHVIKQLSAVPGVREVNARVVNQVTLDVPGLPEPAVGRLVSIPVPRTPSLNELHIREGRWPLANRHSEVIASAAFAGANRLSPGDSVGGVINGRWQWLHIVGTAISPEYVYEIGGATIYPDNKRFGVVWMGQEALADAYSMEGAFNDVSVTLSAGASEREVIAELDRILKPYGTFGAYGRAHQVSHQLLEGEIKQDQITAIFLPAIFLGVTAFLLNIVLSRLVSLERDQIGLLKAFGYSSSEIGGHYILFALIPVAIGSVTGIGLGYFLAGRMALVYARFFQFPSAHLQYDWWIAVTAIIVSAVATLAGTLGPVARLVSLPPAAALNPEPPTHFTKTAVERWGLMARLSPSARIIVRNLERRPLRTVVSVVGLGLALGIVVTTQSMFDSLDFMKELYFHQSAREDVTVVFESPRPSSVLSSFMSLDGVTAVEPFRALPVRLSGERTTYQTVILGLTSDGVLHRIVDENKVVYRPPESGLLLSAILAGILRVDAGDSIHVDVLEGKRPSYATPVVGVTKELMGATAYMDLNALQRTAGGERAISGVYMRIDPRVKNDLYDHIKHIPAVKTVGVRESELKSFEKTIAESFNISLITSIAFACVIAFGMVYNGARVALSERGRELASLRVLGFSRKEVTAMLLGEQGVLLLFAIPVGSLIGYLFVWLISLSFKSELFRFPAVIAPSTYFFGGLVVFLSAVLSALSVQGRLARLDLVAVLKSRE